MVAAASAHRVGLHNLDAGIVRRSKGRTATGGAAYIQRCRIRDERTGQIYDFSGHSNQPLFTGFFAPAHAPEWAKNEAQFWNEVEARENRSDSQVARNFIITLPHEFQQQKDGITHARYALQDFAKEFQRQGYGVSLAIHPAHDQGDQRNLHAHMQISVRQIEKDGTWANAKDDSRPNPAQLEKWKERCAHHLNRQLERFGYDIRVDHRSFEDQGIDRETQIKLGPAATALERLGIATDKGNINRDIEARNEDRLRRQAADLITEYQTTSAVDRLREEEREAERQRPSLDPARRGLLNAIWSLTRTMGGNLSHVVLGADRGDLMQGRSIADEPRQAERDLARQAQSETEGTRQFVDRGRRPAPYHALVQFPKSQEPVHSQAPPAGPAAPQNPQKEPSFLDQVLHRQRQRQQQETERRAGLTPEQRQREDAAEQLRRQLQRERDDDNWGLDL